MLVGFADKVIVPSGFTVMFEVTVPKPGALAVMTVVPALAPVTVKP